VDLAIKLAAERLVMNNTEELSKYVSTRLADERFLPETDPRWIQLVLDRVEELETLRKVTDANGLSVRHMRFLYTKQKFQVTELNSDSVIGMWGAQIVETVYLETDNRERMSVQADKFTLRNMISQSANSPIGYPEVVCPLTYSFSSLF
jgi:hypothetical protein